MNIGSQREQSRSVSLKTDSVGYWNNAECLYTLTSSGSGNSPIIKEIYQANYEYLAEKTVQSWIHSPKHERAISRPDYDVATIVSIIIVDPKNNEIRLDATYHALDKNHTTFNGYVYPVTKKGNR